MNKEFLFDFISKHQHAVVSTVSATNQPEAAVVGIVVTPDLRIFFDTSNVSRKYKNILSNPAMAIVLWVNEQTVQLEGTTRIPSGPELEELQAIYFKAFPDGIKERAGRISLMLSWIRNGRGIPISVLLLLKKSLSN
jgi:uncharacterized pyridoxamine 5'-phosphate oxidase family protein